MFEQAHSQPGRRFATGSSKDDQLLGAFGFIAHMVFFLAIGSGLTLLLSDERTELAVGFFWLNTILSAIALTIRGHQVGVTTTQESIATIKQVWRR
jgi:hypothetical protein